MLQDSMLLQLTGDMIIIVQIYFIDKTIQYFRNCKGKTDNADEFRPRLFNSQSIS